jgi:hypothetical protein
MKKLKIVLVSIAILTAIGSAWANHCAVCEYYTQYYLFNGTWQQAGTMGVNYICLDQVGTCTYYKPLPTSNYVACTYGIYYPIY